ncbi:helix-turn-helix transcriptional regulator [Thermicanus aegyptius]|uniref:helix-turn-helix transcriptional regulator n=1 Tax=Thermicanus aegyptius TaxID=94009 RepID=UPI003CCC23FC
MRIRELMNMTQEQVAANARISRQYYGMIESGDRDPSVVVAKRIASVLNIDWTLFFEDQRNETFLYQLGNKSSESGSKKAI